MKRNESSSGLTASTNSTVKLIADLTKLTTDENFLIQINGNDIGNLNSISYVSELLDTQATLTVIEVSQLLKFKYTRNQSASIPYNILHKQGEATFQKSPEFQNSFYNKSAFKAFDTSGSNKTGIEYPFFLGPRLHANDTETFTNSARPDAVSTVVPLSGEWKSSEETKLIRKEKLSKMEYDILHQVIFDRLHTESLLKGYLSDIFSFAITNKRSYLCHYSYNLENNIKTINIILIDYHNENEAFDELWRLITKQDISYFLTKDAYNIFSLTKSLNIDISNIQIKLTCHKEGNSLNLLTIVNLNDEVIIPTFHIYFSFCFFSF